jgi:hypothetical protein
MLRLKNKLLATWLNSLEDSWKKTHNTKDATFSLLESLMLDTTFLQLLTTSLTQLPMLISASKVLLLEMDSPIPLPNTLPTLPSPMRMISSLKNGTRS